MPYQKKYESIRENADKSKTVFNLRVEDKDGRVVTPIYSGLSSKVTTEVWTDDFVYNRHLFDYEVIGDFIFIVNQLEGPKGVYLFCKTDYAGEERNILQICSEGVYLNNTTTKIWFAERYDDNHQNPSFGFEGKAIQGFVGEDYEYRVSLSTLPVLGAVRFYHTESENWRWLFPHTDGPQASFELLCSTNPEDDLDWFLERLDQMSSDEKCMVYNHFLAAQSKKKYLHRNVSLGEDNAFKQKIMKHLHS